MYTFTSYHNSMGNPLVRNPVNLKEDSIGIELEVESVDYRDSLLAAIPLPKNAGKRPLTERDGSLDWDRGVEIIFPPFTPTELRRKNSFFNNVLTSIAPHTRDSGNSAGMHFNLNRFDATAEKVFGILLSCLPDANHLKLFGRLPTVYCGRNLQGNSFAVVRGYTSAGTGYRLGVHTHRTRLEVRYAASTTDSAKVQDIINFLLLAKEWALQRGSLPNSYTKDKVWQQFNQWAHYHRKRPIVKKLKTQGILQ